MTEKQAQEIFWQGFCDGLEKQGAIGMATVLAGGKKLLAGATAKAKGSGLARAAGVGQNYLPGMAPSMKQRAGAIGQEVGKGWQRHRKGITGGAVGATVLSPNRRQRQYQPMPQQRW